jgi:hypothetical protein
MSTVAECTVPEKILLAADQLDRQGQSPFSAETLIVASWQKYPRTFGLKGYADQYPDSNKVLSSIMGVKGLARRGWLMKMGQKLYALTREGRQIVRRLLQDGEPEPALDKVTLDKEQEQFLVGLLNSTAVHKFEEDRKQELTFADACRFWGITENLRGEVLDDRLQQLQLSLDEFDRLLGTGYAELGNGRNVTVEEINFLGEVHSHMEERFARHLSLLRSRGGRR